MSSDPGVSEAIPAGPSRGVLCVLDGFFSGASKERWGVCRAKDGTRQLLAHRYGRLDLSVCVWVWVCGWWCRCWSWTGWEWVRKARVDGLSGVALGMESMGAKRRGNASNLSSASTPICSR